jgi:hypothetical protein
LNTLSLQVAAVVVLLVVAAVLEALEQAQD